ncbi:MAG: cation:proton antiporter [Armatimonadota bacterium]
MTHGAELLGLLVVFAGAHIGAAASRSVKLPSVVGELLAGVLLGGSCLGWIHPGPVLTTLSTIGATFLLFTVGLESPLKRLLSVGKLGTGVAVLGVLVPFVSAYLLVQSNGASVTNHMYVACCFIATSAGITARVLHDEGALGLLESKVILAAAVIDDVLAMLILVGVSALAAVGASPLALVLPFAEAGLFLTLTGLLGPLLVKGIARHRGGIGPLSPFVLALILCLGLAATAELTGLAAIVGAFLAGMLFADHPQSHEIEKQVQPLLVFLTPYFFVLTGAMVDLRSITSVSAATLLGLYVLVAVLSKLIGAGLAAVSLGHRSALVIGIGMVPRGEVGAIIAGSALACGAIQQRDYSLLVMMSIITTILTPPVLRVLLQGLPKSAPAEEPRRLLAIDEGGLD